MGWETTIFYLCFQKYKIFFKWKIHILSFMNAALWDHEINPVTLLAKFGLEMKIYLFCNSLILFQSLFHIPWIAFFYGRLNVLVTKFENMVAKQNHHSFASHSFHFCIMICFMVYLETYGWISGLKWKRMPGK